MWDCQGGQSVPLEGPGPVLLTMRHCLDPQEHQVRGDPAQNGAEEIHHKPSRHTSEHVAGLFGRRDRDAI